MRSQWERDIAWQALQRDGLTPYREMRRWRRRAVAGWVLAAALALALLVVLQVLAAVN